MTLDEITWKEERSFRVQEQFYFQMVSDEDADIDKQIYCLCEAISMVCGIGADEIYENVPLDIDGDEDLEGFFFKIGDGLALVGCTHTSGLLLILMSRQKN